MSENLYRVISFDVGIKNLAYCIINFNKESGSLHNIVDWGLINLKSDLWVPDHNEKRCQAKDKKGNVCAKTSNCWIIEEGKRVEMCRMHSKNYEKNFYVTVKAEHDILNQNSEKLGFEFYPYELRDLRCYCGEKSRHFYTKIITPEIADKVVTKINLDNIKLAGFCNKCSKLFKKENEEIKLVKVVDYMKEDDTKLYSKLHDGLSNLDIPEINEVIIENQPALKNPRMKSIQMFIYSFFFINGRNGLIKNLDKVGFFSATKKLNPTMIVEEMLLKQSGKEVEKVPDKKKNKKNISVFVENTDDDEKEEVAVLTEYQAYKKRKNDSISIVTNILGELEEWKQYFISHPKKDDLADSLLQGIAQWSMHTHKNLNS